MAILTVSVASALIAAGVALLQFLLPNALALILSSVLADSHSAVTWSVVSRFLLSSDWPIFLRSDAASSHRTDRKVALITYMKPVGLILTAIAAVVTPLGLYEGTYPSNNAQVVAFVRVADPGPISNGTMPQSPLGFSRTCGYISGIGESSRLCPREPDLGNATYMYYNETSTYDNVTSSYNVSGDYIPVSVQIRSPDIPSSLVDLFQAGLAKMSPTLSGFFDITYRQYELTARNYTVDNSSMVQPKFNMPSSYLLQNKTMLVEGLIADFVNGGIGFRSHSVPLNLPNGAQWEEDILWWTPEIECTNTNITLAMTTVSDRMLASQGIIDRGGFVNLEKRDSSTKTSEFWVMDGQATPRLQDRAQFCAWKANALTMYYLNISQPMTNLADVDSEVGKFYEVNSSSLMIPSLTSYSTDVRDRQFPGISLSLDGLVQTSYATNYTSLYNAQLTNPYGIITSNFSDLLTYCEQTDGTLPLNISKPEVKLVMIAGPAYKQDGSAATDWSVPGQVFEKPTYVCSAATKMNVKTVVFRYNATSLASLADLEILNMTDKVYDDRERPLWGMERPKGDWNVSTISPLWGFFDEQTIDNNDISGFQSDKFYLPAGAGSSSFLGLEGSTSSSYLYQPMDNLPASGAASALWSSTFSSSAVGNAPDYTGKNDARFQNLWIDMYRSTKGVSKAYKLIWTDLATSYLTGTKGIHTDRYKAPANAPARRDIASQITGSYPVYVLEHRIRYRWIYGIPAILSMGLVGVVILAALISCIFGRASPDRLRHYLFSVTSGRVLASFIYPDSNEDRLQPTRQWIDAVGYKPINVQGHGIMEMTNIPSKQYVRIEQKGDVL